MAEPVSVLFVCLGNICRSTMAEGIFQSIAKEDKYKGKIDKIDSCGTGRWNDFLISAWFALLLTKSDFNHWYLSLLQGILYH